ncbi:universal stress protein [Azohydromonas caseinilytica]|uniref:Universal stress protein n=1 Tax=Azohydromonas caseinilytica TaxID=2728836 RepID=A0A848FG03_9BURK|nr:universal stress protein [Azohydromonas caseinilytica]NML17183.1 universal stress protein [Azohydromonas caseinilytica]
MYKHLFVPVDGSELSHRAMDGAIELAKQLGARITGFVVEPDIGLSTVSYDPSVYTGRMRDHEQRNEAHASALLKQFEERAVAAGIEFAGSFVTSGAVDDAIANEAERVGADMIVMVTHGRGPLGEFMFGSHTKHVISRSRLPVLVLH